MTELMRSLLAATESWQAPELPLYPAFRYGGGAAWLLRSPYAREVGQDGRMTVPRRAMIVMLAARPMCWLPRPRYGRRCGPLCARRR